MLPGSRCTQMGVWVMASVNGHAALCSVNTQIIYFILKHNSELKGFKAHSKEYCNQKGMILSSHHWWKQLCDVCKYQPLLRNCVSAINTVIWIMWIMWLELRELQWQALQECSQLTFWLHTHTTPHRISLCLFFSMHLPWLVLRQRLWLVLVLTLRVVSDQFQFMKLCPTLSPRSGM